MEDERAAAPQSASSSGLSESSSAPRKRLRPQGTLGERLAHSEELPPRSESQRLRAWNDHRAHLLEYSDHNFETEVIHSDVPVIIDFWAETCAPCRLMHPVMRRIAEVFVGKAKVGRLNVYENPRTTEVLEIKAIPYLVVVKNGDVIFELVGDRSFEDLRRTLEPFLA